MPGTISCLSCRANSGILVWNLYIFYRFDIDKLNGKLSRLQLHKINL